MRFGVIKTLVENKLVKSFAEKKLSKDMKFFKNTILEDKSFKRLYFIYDTLKENKGLDKETATYMVDDLVNEAKSLNLNEDTLNKIKKWTLSVVKENNYTKVDDLIYGDALNPEKKSIAKKEIVESLTKKPVVKEEKKIVPIKSMLKIANANVQKALEELNESEREQVISLLKSEPSKEEFDSLKESTIKKLDSLINESDEDLKKVLSETKEKVVSSNYSKKEFVKLSQLNGGLVI
jgi:arsenate reductase-like glutaredoxin family protein